MAEPKLGDNAMAMLRFKDEAEYKAFMKKKEVAPSAEPKAKQEPSEIEESFNAQIIAAGLPDPKREHPYLIGSRHRLDFAWPDRKIGVEVQGQVHRIKGRFQADIEKRARGLLQGWRILEVSGKEVRSGQAIEWLKQLLENT